MDKLLDVLLASSLFYVVVLVLILVVAFRKQVQNLIVRITKAEGALNSKGVKGKIEARNVNAEQVDSPEHGVVMKKVMLDGTSEIDEISGSVILENVNLDKKSKIGKINGK